MKILIDSNELATNSEMVEQVKKYPGFAKCEFEITNLPTGDCWLILDGQVSPLIIERKTISDLIASTYDERLSNQANEMRQLSEYCYLVICGPLVWSLNKKIIGSDCHFRSTEGIKLSIQELGLCVTHAADDLDYAATLYWLSKRDLSKIKILWPRKTGVPATVHEKILVAFDGIGEANAEKLLKTFGGVIESLIALCDENVELPLPGKIGSKIRSNVRESLGLSVGEKLERVKK